MNTSGSGRIPHLFLSSALDEGESSASNPDRFSPGTHCVSPTAGLDFMESKSGKIKKYFSKLENKQKK
jgi:hypothetical protein